MAKLRVDLPWPPSVNHYWASHGKRRYLSPKARAWMREAWALIKAVRVHFDGVVGVYIKAYPPDGRKRDLDNLLKAVLDALVKAGAIKDDSLVAELCIVRQGPVRGGKVEVVVEEI